MARDAAGREDPHLARIEERVEQLVKRFDRHELALEDKLDGMEARIGLSMDARLETMEARYTVVRLIVFAMAGAILVAFLNFMVGAWLGTPVRFPHFAPAHSSQELKEQVIRR